MLSSSDLNLSLFVLLFFRSLCLQSHKRDSKGKDGKSGSSSSSSKKRSGSVVRSRECVPLPALAAFYDEIKHVIEHLSLPREDF